MGDEGAPGQSESKDSTSRQRQSIPVRIYRTYLGETASEGEVYTGFGLFFSGVTMGLVGLFTFFYSGTQPVGSGTYWQLREIAIVGALIALPAVVLSVPILLSVGKRTLTVSAAGAGVCLIATGWLTQVYPYQWVGSPNDTLVIGTYAIGLVLLTASTGSALVAQYVERATSRDETPQRDGTRTKAEDDSAEAVSKEQVQEDIDEAMSESSLNWGGVEQGGTTTRLNLDKPEEPDINTSESSSASETRATGDDVNKAVDGLRKLQGGEQETASTTSPDEQVEKLTALREQQKKAGDVETGVSGQDGVLNRLRKRLFE